MKALVLLAAAALSASAQLITESIPDIRTGIYKGKRVTFEVIDGLAVAEGDIILGPAEDMEVSDSGQQVIEKPKDYQPKALGIADDFSERLWPEGVIPYTIDASLPNPQRVLDAIKHWNDKSTIRLVERDDDPDWVNFKVHEERCASAVGRNGGEQEVYVPERCSTGGIIHEIGHTVGLFHEHSREDRDSHVNVLFDNIDKRYIFAFNQPIRTGDVIGPYDYGSIMHYYAFGFSRNNQPRFGSWMVASRGQVVDTSVVSQLILYSVAPCQGSHRPWPSKRKAGAGCSSWSARHRWSAPALAHCGTYRAGSYVG